MTVFLDIVYKVSNVLLIALLSSRVCINLYRSYLIYKEGIEQTVDQSFAIGVFITLVYVFRLLLKSWNMPLNRKKDNVEVVLDDFTSSSLYSSNMSYLMIGLGYFIGFLLATGGGCVLLNTSLFNLAETYLSMSLGLVLLVSGVFIIVRCIALYRLKKKLSTDD